MNLGSFLHSLDARSKLLTFLLFIITVISIQSYGILQFAGLLLYLLLSIILSRIPLSFFLKRLGFILVLALIMGGFLPFFKHGNSDYQVSSVLSMKIYQKGLILLGNLLIRSSLSFLAALILAGTTGFTGILSSMERMGLPSSLSLSLGLAYRYLFVLGEEVVTLRRAALSRGYRGKWIWHTSIIGKLIGNLFLRSYERSERVYHAMLSRGFSIKNRRERLRGKVEKMRRADYLFPLASILFFLLVRFLPSIMVLLELHDFQLDYQSLSVVHVSTIGSLRGF